MRRPGRQNCWELRNSPALRNHWTGQKRKDWVILVGGLATVKAGAAQQRGRPSANAGRKEVNRELRGAERPVRVAKLAADF